MASTALRLLSHPTAESGPEKQAAMAAPALHFLAELRPPSSDPASRRKPPSPPRSSSTSSWSRLLDPAQRWRPWSGRLAAAAVTAASGGEIGRER
jgi:hypothetical protein